MKNTVKRPYYSEECKMWAVESTDGGGYWESVNTSWCKNEADAQRTFNLKLSLGYEIVETVDKSIIETSTPAGQPIAQQPVEAPQTDKTFSDDPQAALEDVMNAVAKQDRVHPRDVSFIMDNLSVRQCRAFVQHQGFAPGYSLAWAIELGLIETSGAFTAKGERFLGDVA